MTREDKSERCRHFQRSIYSLWHSKVLWQVQVSQYCNFITNIYHQWRITIQVSTNSHWVAVNGYEHPHGYTQHIYRSVAFRWLVLRGGAIECSGQAIHDLSCWDVVWIGGMWQILMAKFDQLNLSWWLNHGPCMTQRYLCWAKVLCWLFPRSPWRWCWWAEQFSTWRFVFLGLAMTN